jgi:hypothetical protein
MMNMYESILKFFFLKGLIPRIVTICGFIKISMEMGKKI